MSRVGHLNQVSNLLLINEPLVAVPLFIFMGIMLEKTKIAAGLLQSIGELFGSTKGGISRRKLFISSSKEFNKSFSFLRSSLTLSISFLREDVSESEALSLPKFEIIFS